MKTKYQLLWFTTEHMAECVIVLEGVWWLSRLMDIWTSSIINFTYVTAICRWWIIETEEMLPQLSVNSITSFLKKTACQKYRSAAWRPAFLCSAFTGWWSHFSCWCCGRFNGVSYSTYSILTLVSSRTYRNCSHTENFSNWLPFLSQPSF